MKLVIKYPTRARPKLFQSTLLRYYAAMSGGHDVRFVVTADSDDLSMNTDEMRAFLDAQPNLAYRFGNSKTKVEACNADMDLAGDFSIAILASDDMIPVATNIDKIIADEMQERFPDTDGCLWFFDGRRHDLMTLSILGRKYYDRFHYFYHKDFRGLWCDNDAHEVASRLGKIARIPRCIIRHFWTDITGTDELHQRNQPDLEIDRATFIRREKAGFPA